MAHVPNGIYVEILIAGTVDEVWEKTQDPALHQRWDLRFTHIHYLPRLGPAEPQRFRYATRIGFGVGIEGEGESAGSRDEASGRRTSALRFWSADGRSLIREGAGYWQYIPTAQGVRFLTWYDYRTRWGVAGRVLDTAFRPLMGWATAWSFDRLRLWIERGAEPSASMRLSMVHALARVALALVFFWHGLVPKLLFRHPDETVILTDGGMGLETAHAAVLAAGVGEIVLAAALLLAWRTRGLFLLVIALMAAATIQVAATSPRFLAAAFNPVTLNLSVAALAAVGWAASAELASARRCLRRKPAAPATGDAPVPEPDPAGFAR
jgi:hypothetical protein